MNKKTNKVLEDNGKWLLIDISTKTHPSATMAVDSCDWNMHDGGRVYACKYGSSKYIYGSFRSKERMRLFHRSVISGDEIDHIVHGTMTFVDNRRSNLRLVTVSQNHMNSSARSDSETGIAGISWDKARSKWRADIKVNNIGMFLGRFVNIDFAIGARKQAEREYFGEYAFGV